MHEACAELGEEMRDRPLPRQIVYRGLGVFLGKTLLQVTCQGVSLIMPPKISRKRKRTLVRLAGEMREKKRARQETTTATENLDESVELPGPSALPIETESGDRESDGEDYRGEFTSDDARACYDDWLVTLPKENVQMMAMMLFDSYIERFGLLQAKAAEEVALLLGLNEKTIRRWRYDWIDNKGSFIVRAPKENTRDTM